MSTGTKIALSIPGHSKPDQYFSFRLKQDLGNEPTRYRQPKRIFVVSDIEGNFIPFCKLLIRAKVINRYLQWTFQDNHLVILGDCFDRGEQVTECLWLIYSLEEKAKKNGGYVHFILGNHEIMNMNGDWRYVHPKYAATIGSRQPHTALYDGNNTLWRWLRTKNIMEKIGSILFVHAGLADELVQLRLSVSAINNRARPYYTRADETFTDPALSVIYNSQSSPFWYRGFYLGMATEGQVDAALNHFRVNKIITGHTVTNHVSSYFNGKVINVNTDHAAGNSEGLMIIKHRFYRVPVRGRRERIK